MADWIIEPLADDSEIDALLEIEHASFTNPWTRDMYLAELANHGISFFYLARRPDRTVAGFCSLWVVLDELHINNLAISPGDRRRGAATALLAHVLAEGVKIGATRATLEVRRSNEVARRLYEKLGFTLAGTRRSYYTNPVEDALVLCREPLHGSS
jgi:ribosomal-protein-alanine N-acetyltransferase